MSKIFCTFTKLPILDTLVETLNSKYTIIFNRIFVLYAEEQDEYLLTYNVEVANMSNFPENTILVHRKKETNTLYTINALNTLIKSLNKGKVDPNFKIKWEDYRNSVLLTKGIELRKINTKLDRIVNLS